MASVTAIRLTMDGDVLAYAAMKQALETIVTMDGDFTKDKADAIHEAEMALEIEERLGGT